MYNKHEDTRKKFEKTKCPYCNENSNIIETSGTIQYRKCKAGHTFMYDKELETIRRTGREVAPIQVRTTYYPPESCSAEKENNIRMVYYPGQKTAKRILY